jgi:hypothetical protein
MNELPKLEMTTDYEIKINYDDNIDSIKYIDFKSYKSQIAFYEKYKDNPSLIMIDFPNTWKDYCKNNKEFRDWLFNKLFKLEE